MVAQIAAKDKLEKEQAAADEANQEVDDKDTLAGLPSIATGKIVVGGGRSYKWLWITVLYLLLLAGAWYYWYVYRDQVATTGN